MLYRLLVVEKEKAGAHRFTAGIAPA